MPLATAHTAPLFLLVFAALAADDAPAWKELRSEEGNFTVLMPPEWHTRDEPTGKTFTARHGPLTFGVSYKTWTSPTPPPRPVPGVKIGPKPKADVSRDGLDAEEEVLVRQAPIDEKDEKDAQAFYDRLEKEG